MPKTAVAQVNVVSVLPVNRYSPLDSVPLSVRSFAKHSADSLAKAANVPLKVAAKVVAAARSKRLGSAADLLGLGVPLRSVRSLVNVGLFVGDPRVVITDVQPVYGRVMSDR